MTRLSPLALLLLGAAVALSAPSPPTIESWPLCELIGPGAQRPGICGTDLGFTFRHPYRDRERRGPSSASSWLVKVRIEIAPD